MRAIAVHNPGPGYALVLCDSEMPRPGPRQVLVKVAAAGVNRADLLQAKGKYPPPPGAPATLGLEVSGDVVEAGPGSVWQAGAKVCALLAGGGYAAYAVAEDACVLPLPAGTGIIDAAGLPEALFTVWSNLFATAGLKPGETVLIHGGSSGIGTAAIQIARTAGCLVLTTAGGPEKCARCVQLGAAHAIDYRTEDYVPAVMAATANRGVDVILDMVGGDYIGRNFAVAAKGGRIVNIAFQKGAMATVDFRAVIQKHLTFAATTLRGRNIAEKGAIRDALLERIWPLIEARKVKPVIDSVFPLADAGAAHARMAEGGHFGKILLTV